MRIKNFNYENKNVVQIYITKNEYKNNFVQDKINKLKEQSKGNVTVFIAGDTATVPQLKQMVLHQRKQEKL